MIVSSLPIRHKQCGKTRRGLEVHGCRGSTWFTADSKQDSERSVKNSQPMSCSDVSIECANCPNATQKSSDVRGRVRANLGLPGMNRRVYTSSGERDSPGIA